ncbi:MAG: UPF0149 family protein [Methylococcaceae bacterium]|nr:UPF0149 family protein [Methylococcaceae bacterium]
MAYNACDAIIVQTNADLSAAEAHGMATGMLCVNGQADSGTWLAELFANADAAAQANNGLLVRLFDETQRLLGSDEFEFDLLLPDDDEPLPIRIAALKNWCQGFLFGVAQAAKSTRWSKEIRDILKDITEFTQLDDEAEGEDDERAFVEITEYLRSAVLLLRDELDANDTDEPSLWQDA